MGEDMKRFVRAMSTVVSRVCRSEADVENRRSQRKSESRGICFALNPMSCCQCFAQPQSKVLEYEVSNWHKGVWSSG